MADTATVSTQADTEGVSNTTVGGKGANGGIEPLDTHSAADALNNLGLFGEPKAETRQRGPDGKFLPKKPDTSSASRGDEPLPITPADGSPDPDAELQDPDSPYADDKKEPEAEEPKDAKKDPEPAVPPTVKVKVDGLEVEVDIEELKKGYSRTGDYTKKTQALAEDRRRFEQEELTPIREERRYYAERVAALEEAIAALSPTAEPDWNALRPEDVPQAMAQWRGQQQRMEKVRAEQTAVAERVAADERRQQLKHLAEQQEKVKALIPEWADEEKGPVLRRDLIDYAKSLGFSEDEIGGVTDARALKLLNDSRLWAEAQRRKPKAEAKIDRALETMKPSNTPSKPRQSDLDRARANLLKTGSVEDAAALLNSM